MSGSVRTRARPAAARGGIVLLATLGALGLGACSDEGAGATAVQSRDRAVPVRAATVVAKDVPVQLRAIGTVEPYATVEIKSRVEGQVAEVHFREGQAVHEGDPLFSIDARPFEAQLRQAEANLARDRAQASNADTEAERMRRLLDQRIVSQDEHDQARTRAAALRATVKADEAMVESARLQVTYSEVRSPINGRIGRILVNRGNVVKPNETPMAVVNQIQPIYVSFSVPQQELAEVRRRAAAGDLTVDVSPGGDGAQPISGRLSFIDNQVDTESGTLLLKAKFANDDEALWPGQFVDSFITLAVLRDAVVVPDAAVQTGQQGQYVYVIASGDSVELRPVRTGEHVGDDVVIEDGLRAGERVVTDGQLQLAPGSHVEVKSDEAAPRATPAPQVG